MVNKKQYYGLDEIGFVGTQKKVSEAQLKKDMELTSKYFESQQKPARKPVVTPRARARFASAK